jgi:hypothetical protein
MVVNVSNIHSFSRSGLLFHIWCSRSHGESLVCDGYRECRGSKPYVEKKSDEVKRTSK